MSKPSFLSLSVLTVFSLMSVACASQPKDQASCPPPKPPAVCYPDDCFQCPRCLGPENFAGNPPVCPITCNGDWVLTVATFCWNTHQDGMEFAINNDVTNPNAPNPPPNAITQLNQLAEAKYKKPHGKWEWGLKLGLNYCSPCDGWDIGILWTSFHGRATAMTSADLESEHTILPLWSQFVPSQGNILYATSAEDTWKLQLNLIDLELGRHFWLSRYLSVRPFIGLRYASINQRTKIDYNGGSWSANNTTAPTQPGFNGLVDLHNNYRGPGLRTGINSEWNFGCGWSLYSNAALSIIYGKFRLDHQEFIRLARNPHTISTLHDMEESLRASRTILDLHLGIKWYTMFCACRYGFVAMLGWEQHMFFDQNQMWRVSRVGATPGGDYSQNPPTFNLNGANVLQQRRGSLDTQGWTLTLKLDY